MSWLLNAVGRQLHKITRQLSTGPKQIEPWLKAYLDFDDSHMAFEQLTDDQKRTVVELERVSLRECGEKAPEAIPEKYWPELLSSNVRQRHKLFRFLFLKEVYAEQKREAREAKAAFMEMKRQAREEKIKQGLRPSNYPGYTSYFQHMGPRQELYFDRMNFVSAMRLNNRLYIDCAFEEAHRPIDLKYLAEQILMATGMNKNYSRPFAITLCNFREDGRLAELIKERVDTLEHTLLDFTEKDLLDLESRDKLVYLSPQAPIEMKEYDPDKAYVIGGLVDKPSRPFTYTKAMELGIRCEKLPLDSYLKFDGGTKDLTIDQMVNIMDSLASNYAGWPEALKWVPSRKLRHPEDEDHWGLSVGLK